MSSDEEKISVTVKNNAGETVGFKLNKTTKFNKLMNAYCKKAGYQPGAVKFFFDGKLISEDDCPNSMGISNEDEIEALTDQYGGGSFC